MKKGLNRSLNDLLPRATVLDRSQVSFSRLPFITTNQNQRGKSRKDFDLENDEETKEREKEVQKSISQNFR